MRREHLGEVRFDVRADDADRVDHGLSLARVIDELARKLGVFDGRVLGHERSHQLEVDPPLDRLGEIRLDAITSVVERGQFGELAPRTAFVGSCDRQRAFETASSRVRDDRGGRV